MITVVGWFGIEWDYASVVCSVVGVFRVMLFFAFKFVDLHSLFDVGFVDLIDLMR